MWDPFKFQKRCRTRCNILTIFGRESYCGENIKFEHQFKWVWYCDKGINLKRTLPFECSNTINCCEYQSNHQNSFWIRLSKRNESWQKLQVVHSKYSLILKRRKFLNPTQINYSRYRFVKDNISRLVNCNRIRITCR